MTIITLDQDKCGQCGTCVALCTGHVFAHVGQRVEVVAAGECWLCGHCVAACPNDAITHSDYPFESCPPLDAAALPSLDSLVTAFRARRSARVFRDRPVPRDVLHELIGIARWVPSAGNGQPVDWCVLDDPAGIAALSAATVATYARTARLLRNRLLRPFLWLTLGPAKLRAGLESAEGFEELVHRHAQGQDPIFRRAPVVLFAHVPAGSYFGRDDAIYAAYNLMLAAERLGLGTCQIGYFNVALERNRDLQRAVGLADDRKIEAALTLGYPKYRFRRLIPRRQPELIAASA